MNAADLEKLKLYPHFKLTKEKFPRLLATRKIENDQAEYFGAFLPKAGARILLDFINKTFRLRSCEIEVDGDFLYPCPMFYRKRCLAPCVEKICNQEEYLEKVALLRLFLLDKRSVLTKELNKKIKKLSDDFEFEKAAEWRDLLLEVEKLWKNKRMRYWIENAKDSWEVKKDSEGLYVFLVTQQGRKILGRRAFYFENPESSDEILSRILPEFYQVYVPKEIRVFSDFEGRLKIAEILSKRFSRKIKIQIENKVKPTTKRGLKQTKFDLQFSRISYKDDFKTIQKYLKKEFNLKKIPEKIEAFDAAHISGTDTVTAKIVWKNGVFLNKESEVWDFDEVSEPEAIQNAVRKRFENKKFTLPDVILIDGGKTQLKAALKGLEIADKKVKVKIISAVKPAGQHSKIEYFLDENFEKILIEQNELLNFLTRIRDASHNLANQTHAVRRDTSHFYELARTLPTFSESERRLILQKTGSIKKLKNADFEELKITFGDKQAKRIFDEIRREKPEKSEHLEKLVPIRFDAPGGDAEDLQPIDRYNL